MRHYYICHRYPHRTFKIGKWYLPICSRCTGIYLGISLCYILIHFINVTYTLFTLFIAILISAPTFIDATTQLLGFRESNNKLRFITGLIAGFGLLILVKGIKLTLGMKWGVIP